MRIIKGAPGRITGHFGDKGVPGANVPSHLGMDIGHGEMTAADLRVGAPAPGTVTAAGWFGTYGNRIIIDHGRDAAGVRWESLLAHLRTFKTTVGKVIPAYDVEVAVMGGTGGDWPVHLHQELRRNGVPVNPELYLTSLAGLIPNPITEEELMPEAGYYVIEEGKSTVWWISHITGKKRKVGGAQWNSAKESAGKNKQSLVLVPVTTAELRDIPTA